MDRSLLLSVGCDPEYRQSFAGAPDVSTLLGACLRLVGSAKRLRVIHQIALPHSYFDDGENVR